MSFFGGSNWPRLRLHIGFYGCLTPHLSGNWRAGLDPLPFPIIQVQCRRGKLKQLIRPVRGFKTLKTAYATIRGLRGDAGAETMQFITERMELSLRPLEPRA